MDRVSIFRDHHTCSDGTESEFLVIPEWDNEAWRKLFAMTTPRRFQTSEVVIQRGIADRSLYFVLEGLLEVGVTYVDGLSISPLAHICAGSVIGEQSFFDGLPRSANVWGLSTGELLCLTHENFKQFAAAEPAVTAGLLFALGRILSLRLRNTSSRVRR